MGRFISRKPMRLPYESVLYRSGTRQEFRLPVDPPAESLHGFRYVQEWLGELLAAVVAEAGVSIVRFAALRAGD